MIAGGALLCSGRSDIKADSTGIAAATATHEPAAGKCWR